MQRLIGKQIWKFPKIWEGFIKCCQLLKNVSHQILLQNQQHLPIAQLKEVITQVPELKEHLRQHLQANPGQVDNFESNLLYFRLLITNLFSFFKEINIEQRCFRAIRN